MKIFTFLVALLTFVLFSNLAAASNITVDISANTTSIMPGEAVEFTVNVTNNGTDPIYDYIIEVYGLGAIVGDLHKLSSDPMWEACTIFMGEDVCFWRLGPLEAGKSKIVKIIATGDTVGGGGTVVYAALGTSFSRKLHIDFDEGPWVAIIPEFPSIAVPMVLSVFSFGIISKFRKTKVLSKNESHN